MLRRLLAIGLALAPVAVAAQSGAGNTPASAPSSSGVYGPPAPVADDGARTPPVSRAAAAGDAQSRSKHRGHGHRRGGYVGADAGGIG